MLGVMEEGHNDANDAKTGENAVPSTLPKNTVEEQDVSPPGGNQNGVGDDGKSSNNIENAGGSAAEMMSPKVGAEVAGVSIEPENSASMQMAPKLAKDRAGEISYLVSTQD